jgi:LacI family transcriptional regulator
MPPSSSSGSVTIGDVAAMAQVSTATVSRVMNGRSTVDPGIAARVLAAAESLRYAPSAVARGLALGRTSTVGLVVPDLANPSFQSALRGLSRAAGVHGYRVLVADSAEDVGEEPILATEARRRCDALVLCAPRMPSDALLDLVPRLAPVVLLNRDVRGIDAPLLAVDYASGIRDLVHHLVQFGHRRLAYLAGPKDSASNAERLRGLHGLDGDVDLVEIPCGARFSDGHEAADPVLAAGVTGVLAFNDLVAFGLLGALHERNVDVPGDLSVVGFDDIQFARYTTPALTTVSAPQEELGEQAWRRLRSLLDGERPEHNVFYRPRLERRASSGPCPA